MKMLKLNNGLKAEETVSAIFSNIPPQKETLKYLNLLLAKTYLLVCHSSNHGLRNALRLVRYNPNYLIQYLFIWLIVEQAM